jgi:hypothetical protein
LSLHLAPLSFPRPFSKYGAYGQLAHWAGHILRRHHLERRFSSKYMDRSKGEQAVTTARQEGLRYYAYYWIASSSQPSSFCTSFCSPSCSFFILFLFFFYSFFILFLFFFYSFFILFLFFFYSFFILFWCLFLYGWEPVYIRRAIDIDPNAET